MPLKGVGIGTRLVGAHAGTDLAVVAQGTHHRLDVDWIVYRAQPCEDMQRLLIKAHVLIGEPRGADVSGVAADHAVFARNPNHFLNPGEAFDLGLVQAGNITDQINLGECTASAGDAVAMWGNSGLGRKVIHHRLTFGSTDRAVGSQDDYHYEPPCSIGKAGSLPHSDHEPA